MKILKIILLIFPNFLLAQYSHTSSYFATDHAFLNRPNKLILESKMGFWNQVNYTATNNFSFNVGLLFDAFDTPIGYKNIYPQVGMKAKIDFHELIYAGISSTLFLSFNYEKIGGFINNHYNFNQAFITLGNPKNNLSIGRVIYHQKIEGEYKKFFFSYLSASVNIKNDFNVIIENVLFHDNISSLGLGFSYQRKRFGLTVGLVHGNLGNEYDSYDDLWKYIKIPVVSCRYYLTK
jgi:hypothetical protein